MFAAGEPAEGGRKMQEIERPALQWPTEGNARVPYRMFSDPDIYRTELSRLFLGPTWQYLALAGELSQPGDYLTTFLGETPVIVSRGHDGELPSRRARPQKASRRPIWRPRLRHAVARGAAVGELHRQSDRVAHPSGDARQAKDPRDDLADPAQQLEALFRECAGHLPRDPAAFLFHDLPHLPPDLGGRRRYRRERGASRELHAQQGRSRRSSDLRSALCRHPLAT